MEGKKKYHKQYDEQHTEGNKYILKCSERKTERKERKENGTLAL